MSLKMFNFFIFNHLPPAVGHKIARALAADVPTPGLNYHKSISYFRKQKTL